MESLSMVPYKIIPLHQKDGDFKQVLAWSKEERIFKNGSYQKLDLMEQFVLDKAGKVKGFKQWVAIDSANYGFPYGGKFFGRKESEYTGRPFVFSNRNETKIIEDIKAGILNHKKIKIETNRKQAIYQTLIELKDSPESVLLIAGKGHESYQEIKGKQYEFNDKEMIRSVMSTI